MVGRRLGLKHSGRPRSGGLALAGATLSLVLLAPQAAFAQLIAGTAPAVSNGGQTPIIVTSDRVTDITLGAARTVINWSSYTLGADQTAVYRFQDPTWIVLNRITGQAVIDGQIEALVGAQRNSGHVWFSAPGGIIFGANARVNVGGLLATTASVGQAAFLDTAGARFGFTGANTGDIQVRSGAQLRTGSGPLAFIAGSVATQPGSSMIAGGTVLYAAASDFTVRFAAQPGGLDLMDFIVPVGGGAISATPLSLQGDTVGGAVILAVVNRADVANAVINATGLIAAQSARADGGDIILSAGVDVLGRQPGSVRTNAVTETVFNLGVVSAQRDLLAGFGQPTTVRAAQLSAGRDLALASASLNVGALNAGRQLVVDAGRDITLRDGASAGASASFRSSGALSVGSGGISAIGRLQVNVGSVTAGRLSSGRSVVVNAGGPGVGDLPAINLGSVLAEDDILLSATHATGSIALTSAAITGARTDEAPLGRTLSLTATGAQGDVRYGNPTGGSEIRGATRVIFSAGRDVTANVTGLLTLAGGSAGRNYLIRADDLDLTGPLTAANLRVESLGGRLRLGSSPAPAASGAALGAQDEPALSVSDRDFQQITVTNEASFYAGATIAPGRGNLTVLSLQVDTARVPQLLLAAGGANDVLVTGVLAPISGGGILTIGENDILSPWRPGRIVVTGAIGFSTGSPALGFDNLRPFEDVRLNALRDIILGSSRFVSLVESVAPGDINISANRPIGVGPNAEERDRVFLTSGNLSLAASERIVQQNTGSAALPNGILITSRNLLAGGLSVTPARVVDLFGAFRNSRGEFVRDLQPILRDGGATSPIIRFNGCSIGDDSCTVTAITRRALKLKDLELIDPDILDGLFTLPPEPPVLVVAGPDPDVIVTDPVALGTGSDELWRRKKGKPQPAPRRQ